MKRVAAPALLVPAAMVFVSALAGCGGAKKVAAKVNRDVITEDEFNDRVQRVTAYNLVPAIEAQGRLPGRAGEFALQTMIAERLVAQYAAEKKASPTDAQITAYISFAKKYRNPQLTLVPLDPFRDETDWRRDVRATLSYRNLVLAAVKLAPDELQKLYDKFKPQLAERDQYHVRMIDIKSGEAKAKAAQEALKKLPFETVALTQSEDPVSGPKNGDIGFVMDTVLPPPLLEAVKKLKPGEFTKAYMKVQMPAGGAAPTAQTGKTETHYFFVQLVENKPGRMPTLEECRPLLENYAITQKDPGAFSRVQNSLREFQEKSSVEIQMKQYKELESRFKKPIGSAAPPPSLGGR